MSDMVVRQGNFKITPLTELLEQLEQEKATGELEVKSGRHAWRLLLREGKVLSARKAGEENRDLVVELLEKSGAVPSEAIRVSLKKQIKSMRSRIDILLEEGVISMVLYSRAVSAVLRLRVAELFAETKAQYLFRVNEEIHEEPGVRSLGVETILRFKVTCDEAGISPAKILRRLQRPVLVKDSTLKFSHGKPLFYNYLNSSADFLDFIAATAKLMQDKRINIPGLLGVDRMTEFVAMIGVRSAALFLLSLLFYLITSVALALSHTAPGPQLDYTLWKADVVSRLYRFETGKDPDHETLFQSGFLSQKEIEMLSKK